MSGGGHKNPGWYHLCGDSASKCRFRAGGEKIVHSDRVRHVFPEDVLHGHLSWLSKKRGRELLEQLGVGGGDDLSGGC
eukprot:5620558-Amphidinium_carterae.1